VHPDGVVVPVFPCHDVGEGFVGLPVRCPSTGFDRHPVDQIMEQRPQHPVREAVIVAVDLFG
jgi:hypothetical protein